MAYSYQIMEIKHGNVYVPADDIERLTELQDIGYKHAQIGYEAFVDIATYFLRHMRLSIPRASFKDKVTQKEQNHYNLSNETYLRREIALTLIEQSKIWYDIQSIQFVGTNEKGAAIDFSVSSDGVVTMTSGDYRIIMSTIIDILDKK